MLRTSPSSAARVRYPIVALGVLAISAAAAAAPTAHADTFGWGYTPNLSLADEYAPATAASTSQLPGVLAEATGAAVSDQRSLVVTSDGVHVSGTKTANVLGFAPAPEQNPANDFFLIPDTAGTATAAAGTDGALLLAADGTVRGFGRNQYGAAGQPVNTQTPTPTAIAGLSDSANPVVEIAAGQRFGLARKQDGTVWAWGLAAVLGSTAAVDAGNSGTPRQVNLPVGAQAEQVAAGYSHALAVVHDGTGQQRVIAWGTGSSGAIGDGTTANAKDPKVVFTPPVGTTIRRISAGTLSSFVLLSDGTYRSWGQNGSGQLGLGNGGATPITVPTGPSAGAPAAPPFTDLVAGPATTYAITDAGQVYGWGTGSDARLGAVTPSFPHAFPYPAGPTPQQIIDGDYPAIQNSTEIPQRVPGLREAQWLARGALGRQQVAGASSTLVPLGGLARVSFYSQPVGTLSVTRISHVRAVDDPATFKRVRITGPAARDFFIVGQSSSEVTFPYSIPAGASFGTEIRFAPQELGLREASLVYEADGKTTVVGLEGYGTELPGNTPGEKGDPGIKGDPGAKGDTTVVAAPAGTGGAISFAATRAVTTVRRGQAVRLPFLLLNGTSERLGKTTLTASLPAGLHATGSRTTAVSSTGSGKSRSIGVRVKVGTRAKLGAHRVRVSGKIAGRAVARTVTIRVRR